MGSWQTKTFRHWWMVKLGIYHDTFSNVYTKAGNYMEIPIIRAVEALEGRRIKTGKHPCYIRKYRIRANYDGLCRHAVIEIKTAKKMFSSVPMHYQRQCQVLMYATGRRMAQLYAYEPTDMDYLCPYYPCIRPERLKRFEINYNPDFIENAYLPRVEVLAAALKQRRFPIWEKLNLITPA